MSCVGKTITITGPGDPSATIVPGDTLPLDTTVTADGKQRFMAISSDTIKPLTDWLAQNRPPNYKPAGRPSATAPTSTPKPKAKSKTKAGGASRS